MRPGVKAVATVVTLMGSLSLAMGASNTVVHSIEHYRNPVLHADYSDPDAIRVGDTYFMTASSFSNVPGLPLLTSKDLVNWTLVGHALPRLVPEEHYSTPRFGGGVWAPCLRFQDGKFWIFYPDPDFGVYVITANTFAGPWSAPHLLLAGKGIIDPTPLWDNDGKAYLLHGWAKSRSGINNKLTLRRMSADGQRVLDEIGTVIIDGDRLPGYKTLEGPKFYKHDGWYYVFAPAGGVENGWQSVFRSRKIGGPYEDRIVLEQGGSQVNGPHQGAWVRAQDGSDWFMHFQDKKAYGRIVHLQPMQWRDGWPLIGQSGIKPGVGNPVDVWPAPAGYHAPPGARDDVLPGPVTSDEFSEAALGLQWQWIANPDPAWTSLAARPGWLRMPVVGNPLTHDYVRAASNILTQKMPAAEFTVDTRVELSKAINGDRAGLILNGSSYSWLGLRQHDGRKQLVYTTCELVAPRCTEHSTVLLDDVPSAVRLRMQMKAGGQAQFSYKADGGEYVVAGPMFDASKGVWVGAQIGLFSVGDQAGTGYLDVEYFRVTP